MTRPRFSIGIDLGTTNTALAFSALENASSGVLAIPQLESAVTLVESPTLPSFLYLPEDVADAVHTAENQADERWVIGRLARSKAAETPGRVVHSAKSWLAHHTADRESPILPWASDEVERDDKISPIHASALILRYLREAWNDARTGDNAPFDSQLVTITVPASFDAVAQRLTLQAAHEAGYPQTVCLLEEPQAALYRWLEVRHPSGGENATFKDVAAVRHVLVVDIGGGTSDFSLFAFGAQGAMTDPPIERIAVSEHILLGGDNMDLALALKLESTLLRDGENLSGRQWEYLVARCRDLKEAALSTVGSSDDTYTVSIPGRGSRLIAQATSTQLTRREIERLLIDGFFPECSPDEYPIRAKTALRELGLPYARDPAVTRHLADFLRDRPIVDAVLFNGGSLAPPILRERIRSQIGAWQSGAMPIELINDEPDLAVARGAARFGKLVQLRAQRIHAGAAHAIFLQAQRTVEPNAREQERTLVCVLPKNAPTQEAFTIADLGLELQINRPVRFQTYSSARHGATTAGEVVVWNDRDFHALPALETAINVDVRALGSTQNPQPAGAPIERTIPIRLTAQLSELGQLEIACESADRFVPGSWPIAFDLRSQQISAQTDVSTVAPSGSTSVGNGMTATRPSPATAALETARARILTLFTQPINGRDKLTATRLLKSLEQLLGIPKSAWDVGLVRSLWTTLAQCMDDRKRSLDHEEAWLIVAGFLLRPGFGAALDDARIDRLWMLRDGGAAASSKAIRIQEYVLWRRVAGGLSAQRQEEILAPQLAVIRKESSPPPELILLAGTLERIASDLKLELIDRFIDIATTLEHEQRHNAHLLAALGYLLNRAPLYGGPEIVVSSDQVQKAYDAFTRFDWDGPKRLELQTLFLRAARIVDNRGIDVPRSLRHRIADKLEKSGVPAAKTSPLKEYMPIPRAEQAGSFGESLPPGLIFREPSPI